MVHVETLQPGYSNYVVTHGAGSRDVHIEVHMAVEPYETVMGVWEFHLDLNRVELEFHGEDNARTILGIPVKVIVVAPGENPSERT